MDFPPFETGGVQVTVASVTGNSLYSSVDKNAEFGGEGGPDGITDATAEDVPAPTSLTALNLINVVTPTFSCGEGIKSNVNLSLLFGILVGTETGMLI